jgi:hypothetical protein
MTGKAVDKEDTAAATISKDEIRERLVKLMGGIIRWWCGGGSRLWGRWRKTMGEIDGAPDSTVGFLASNKTVIPCSFTSGIGC